ncbi:arsenic-transporting ATPase [Corynebacterium sp. 13CS0277]|uniref:ArsA family ATPase n=1 Tax=Corynebacterium sp. 13CS0277 TaxID=2071994 RepID=UPI000D02CC5E|nr:ArsA family ATPase [Corynebacterium sp. 13CS0277]PRQ11896.1 arsenic-transporting ATPase [Corynebacterium sp. 13CS0277]
MLLDTSARLHFFGGKGGVGKTTLATTTAWHLAGEGRRVLLVSTDPAHNIGHLLGQPIAAHPTPVAPGLAAVELDPDATAAAHIEQVRRTMRRLTAPRLHRAVEQHLELAATAPGTVEAATIERLAHLAMDEDYDTVVVDTAPTGHTTRLLALPELMTAWMEGLLGHQDRSEKLSRAARSMRRADDTRLLGEDPEPRSAELRAILTARRNLYSRFRARLTDDAAFHIVLTAERMPVAESLDLARHLDEAGLRLADFIANRRSPRDQGEFLAQRADLEEGFLAELRRARPDVPVVEVPWLGGDMTGTAAVERLRQELLPGS